VIDLEDTRGDYERDKRIDDELTGLRGPYTVTIHETASNETHWVHDVEAESPIRAARPAIARAQRQGFGAGQVRVSVWPGSVSGTTVDTSPLHTALFVL